MEQGAQACHDAIGSAAYPSIRRCALRAPLKSTYPKRLSNSVIPAQAGIHIQRIVRAYGLIGSISDLRVARLESSVIHASLRVGFPLPRE